MIKVRSEYANDVHVNSMKDGDVGIITNWKCKADYVGRVVQRYKKNLVTLGSSSGYSWSGIFIGEPVSDECRVRILPVGSTLEIV